jgi:hypothetical protein
LRAIQHGCTPESGPAIEVPRDDPAWDLIQNGWQWLIFSHLVEKQWPMLPSMPQGALNSANAISKAANELELAAQLAMGCHSRKPRAKSKPAPLWSHSFWQTFEI